MAPPPRAHRVPVWLLPGLLCDASLWDGVRGLPKLAGHAVGTADLKNADSVDDMAAEVLEHAPEHFALVGFSMGGIVALRVVDLAPERVAGLALIATNPRADAPERAREREHHALLVRAGRFAELVRDHLVPAYFAPANSARTDLGATVMAMARRCGSETWLRQNDALSGRADQRGTLARVDCPTLVICGESDRICPVAMHRYMADEIAGARLAVLQDAGHMVVLEQPGRVGAELARWLAEVQRHVVAVNV